MPKRIATFPCTEQNCGENFPKCGKITCYRKRGCRCETCAATLMDYNRRYYEKNRETSLAQANRYNEEHRDERRDYDRRYKAANREILNERAKSRYWADPEKHREKAARDRAKDPVGYRAKRRQWRLDNIESYLAIERRSAEKHREKRNAAAREYARVNPENNRRQQHRRRIRLQSGEVFTVLERDLRRLLHRYNHACFYCGGEEGLTLDHVIPVARGEFSRHSIGNLIPACKPCNSSKSDRTIMEWRLGRISPSRVRRRKKAA